MFLKYNFLVHCIGNYSNYKVHVTNYLNYGFIFSTATEILFPWVLQFLTSAC